MLNIIKHMQQQEKVIWYNNIWLLWYYKIIKNLSMTLIFNYKLDCTLENTVYRVYILFYLSLFHLQAEHHDNRHIALYHHLPEVLSIFFFWSLTSNVLYIWFFTWKLNFKTKLNNLWLTENNVLYDPCVLFGVICILSSSWH